MDLALWIRSVAGRRDRARWRAGGFMSWARPQAAAAPATGWGVRAAWVLAVSSLLSGCNFAPHYDPPTLPSPAAFKEATPGGDAAQGWKIAEPRDAWVRTPWWEVYDDPELSALESRVAISNQTILAAEANYRAAHALAQEAQAQLFPTLSVVPSATREKSSAAVAGIGGSSVASTAAAAGATSTTTPTTSTSTTSASTTTSSNFTQTRTIFELPLEASYQIDLWGSVRNTVAANRFAAQASAATLANALLSTQTTLAQDYFQLRVADEQRRILDVTVADYQVALRLVEALVEAGVDSQADVAAAETQLASALAAATDVGVARAQYEHAIAVLIGVAPAQFSIPYQRFDGHLPQIPVGVPSDLIERRPDIAAAERQVAQSNAQIGVARAAFFPTLTLSATGGYESTAISQLFKLPNRFWSVGPSLAQTVFDGGARRAAVAQAHAENDSESATYRAAVLAAFQSVEDNLAALRILATELGQAHKATLSAERALELTLVLFRQGIDGYTNLITAQTAFLSARQTEIGVRLKQFSASVNLINALGGGWADSQLAATARMAEQPPTGGDEPRVPEGNAGPGEPNPPPIPLGEIKPDDLIERNEALMR